MDNRRCPDCFSSIQYGVNYRPDEGDSDGGIPHYCDTASDYYDIFGGGNESDDDGDDGYDGDEGYEGFDPSDSDSEVPEVKDESCELVPPEVSDEGDTEVSDEDETPEVIDEDVGPLTNSEDESEHGEIACAECGVCPLVASTNNNFLVCEVFGRRPECSDTVYHVSFLTNSPLDVRFSCMRCPQRGPSEPNRTVFAAGQLKRDSHGVAYVRCPNCCHRTFSPRIRGVYRLE